MNVSEAVARRRSVRAFRSDPVAGSLVRELLAGAGRAPSGGNLQPWHVDALGGRRLEQLLADVKAAGVDPHPSHAVYPEALAEPYRSRRYDNGEQLYATIGIDRGNRPGRLAQFARNATFFGAPVGLFVLVDRQMGPAQWADLGMFIQTFMLLAVERGLDTCPQAYWALHADTILRFLDAPPDHRLFCGIALGYADEDAPINQLRTTRAPAEEWCRLQGLED